MLGGCSRKFLRQCKIELSRGNLREQKVLESAFSGFQTAYNPKFWQPQCHLQDILGILQTSHFELLEGWNLWIWCMTDVIVISHLGLFFALLPP